VGDNLEWDVVAPARLGVRGVLLDRRGAGNREGADVTIRSLADLRVG
jgi:FMN phosphatase YigB (HAD superfamily)